MQVLDPISLESLLYQSLSLTSIGEYLRVRFEGVCTLSVDAQYAGAGNFRVSWNLCDNASVMPLPQNMDSGPAWWSNQGRWISYFTQPDSTGLRQFRVFDTQGADEGLCDVHFGTPHDSTFAFHPVRLPWPHGGRFLLATVRDSTDGVDKAALIPRDSPGLHFLAPALGEAHWSP